MGNGSIIQETSQDLQEVNQDRPRFQGYHRRHQHVSDSSSEEGEIEEQIRPWRARTHHHEPNDIPTFNGKRDIEEFLEWIKNVEGFFKYANTPEHKVQLVALKLWWCFRMVGTIGGQSIPLWEKSYFKLGKIKKTDEGSFLAHQLRTNSL